MKLVRLTMIKAKHMLRWTRTIVRFQIILLEIIVIQDQKKKKKTTKQPTQSTKTNKTAEQECEQPL